MASTLEWLTLFHHSEIKMRTLAELMITGKNPAEIIALPARFGLQLSSRWNPQAVEKDLTWQQAAADHHILFCHDEKFPPMLRQIAAFPPVLYVQGDVNVLSQYQLAVVGSRNPSVNGSNNAHVFAQYLAQQNVVVTSGLAVGIDTAAHEGALNAGGKTIAVAATGLDRVYPARNQALAERIRANGAIVSEFFPGTPPRKQYFPQRNRIISGLAQGVLVVEAALRSGSLITAQFALDQGREVFALPGSIHNPLSRGCHALIKQGAKLVETGEDIYSELSTWKTPRMALAKTPHFETPAQQRIWSAMGDDATALDTILQRTHMASAEVSVEMMKLELSGWIASVPGGYVKCSP